MIRSNHLLRLLSLVLLFLGPFSCKDLGPEGPSGPGAIHLSLVSPNGAEGAAVFELVGGTGIGVVSSSDGEVFYQYVYGRQTTRVVVVKDVPGVIGFRVRTSDVGDLPTVQVLQVADGNDVLREPLTGYGVEMLPVADGAGT